MRDLTPDEVASLGLNPNGPDSNAVNLQPHIDAASTETGLHPDLIKAIIMHESSGNPKARSPTGPVGLMQLGSAAANEMGISEQDRTDPEKAILAGSKYYKQQLDTFGPKLAYAAYHDGPNAVKSYLAGKRDLSSQALIGTSKFSAMSQLADNNQPRDLTADEAIALGLDPNGPTPTSQPPSMRAPKSLGEETKSTIQGTLDLLQNSGQTAARGLQNFVLPYLTDPRAAAQLQANPAEQVKADLQRKQISENVTGADTLSSLASFALPASTFKKAALSAATIAGLNYSPNITPKEQAINSAIGGVSGGVLSKLLSPRLEVNPNAQSLIDQGVNSLTPGQMVSGGLGKTVKGFEDKLSSIPFLGEQTQTLRGKSLQDFNLSEINKAIAPALGQNPTTKILNSNTPAGYQAIDEAHRFVSGIYDKLLDNTSIKLSNNQISSISNVGAFRALPAPYFNKFSNTVDNVTHPLSTSTSGNEYQKVMSDLNTKIRKFNASPDPQDNDVADHLLKVKDNLTNLLVHPNTTILRSGRPMTPDHNQALKSDLFNANVAFAKLSVLEKASSNVGARNGVFTPQHLLSAIKGNQPAQFARGNAFNQMPVSAAREVLPSSVPDSGTAGRALAAGLLTSAGLHMISPLASIPAFTLSAGATRTGQDLLKSLLFGKNFNNAVMNRIGMYSGSQAPLH